MLVLSPILSRIPSRIASIALATCLVAFVGAVGKAAYADHKPLQATPALTVPGSPGAFDWMEVDGAMGRLYAAHSGTKTLTVLDLKTGKLLPSVATGEVQGIAVDEKDNKVFVGDAEEQKVVVLDRKTLKPLAEIKLDGPVDAIAYDPKNGKVYADHDDGKNAWAIDAKTNRLVGTVALSGAPEYIEYDPRTDRLYQNIKTANTVEVINPATDTVVASWPTTPANGPHGLAVDSAVHRLYTAGSGHVAAIDLGTGKIVGTSVIAPGHVDQIAYDAKRHRLYCSVAGAISVLEPTSSGIHLLANVPQPKGAHTLTVNPANGDVWICYADTSASHLMKFTFAH